MHTFFPPDTPKGASASCDPPNSFSPMGDKEVCLAMSSNKLLDLSSSSSVFGYYPFIHTFSFEGMKEAVGNARIPRLPWLLPDATSAKGHSVALFVALLLLLLRATLLLLCLSFFDPMDYSLPDSSVHGILQARIMEWVAVSFSKINSTSIKKIFKEKKCGIFFKLIFTRVFLLYNAVLVSSVYLK